MATTIEPDDATSREERLDQEQVDRANATGRMPVVFVHGLWLLPNSWDRWAALFKEAGFVALSTAGPTILRRSSKRPEKTRTHLLTRPWVASPTTWPR